MKTESKIQYRQADIEFEIKKLEIEAQTKKELMQKEFELNVELKKLEFQAQQQMMQTNNQSLLERETVKEDNANQREAMKVAATDKTFAGPPKSGKPLKSFESKGNDVLGGIDLSRFDPK